MRSIDFDSWAYGAVDLDLLISVATGRPYCAGDHNPDYLDPTPGGCITETVTCADGRYSKLRQGNCLHGQFREQTYRDCFIKLYTLMNKGFYAPPCPADQAWDDSAFDQSIISPLVACQSDQTVYVDPGQPSDDGGIFPRPSDIRMNPNLRTIRQSTNPTFGESTSTGGMF